MTVPRLAGFRMPAEWEPHTRTWMEFPPVNETFDSRGDGGDGELERLRRIWASVSNTIARFEPVSVVCNVGDAEVARSMLDEAIEVHETPTGDAWVRDSGPTFLVHPDGRLGAAHWTFNAWGGQDFSDPTDERHVGAFIAGLAGAELFSSSMVNEGGGIHVDGEGTVMVTTTVQLDPGRNPGWNAEQVETELRSYLDVERVIWLPRGLTKDYERFGTRGHVDIIATFCRPGTVLAHVQTRRDHPDWEICQENLRVLRASTDAAGRPLEVIEVPAPLTTHVPTPDGDELVDWSYINHYVCNGAVILCGFDDPNDDVVAALMADAYPGREIVLHDARDIFAVGGGIHCITQQQPAV